MRHDRLGDRVCLRLGKGRGDRSITLGLSLGARVIKDFVVALTQTVEQIVLFVAQLVLEGPSQLCDEFLALIARRWLTIGLVAVVTRGTGIAAFGFIGDAGFVGRIARGLGYIVAQSLEENIEGALVVRSQRLDDVKRGSLDS
ncbi:MAG: hypothetical protein IH940_07980 [Acidobacteria bacterium]|nr:hypothetical protein [Acidobacteriota bacterium]